jgi:hypothetical protein
MPAQVQGSQERLMAGHVMIDEYQHMPIRREVNGSKLNLLGKATFSNIVCAFL